MCDGFLKRRAIFEVVLPRRLYLVIFGDEVVRIGFTMTLNRVLLRL